MTPRDYAEKVANFSYMRGGLTGQFAGPTMPTPAVPAKMAPYSATLKPAVKSPFKSLQDKLNQAATAQQPTAAKPAKPATPAAPAKPAEPAKPAVPATTV